MHRETEGGEQAVSALVRAFYVSVWFLSFKVSLRMENRSLII